MQDLVLIDFTVSSIMGNPITFKLVQVGKKELVFAKPIHSPYNYLTLHY